MDGEGAALTKIAMSPFSKIVSTQAVLRVPAPA